MPFDTIKVFVTSGCNLNCKHCYQFADKNKFQLTVEQLNEIVDFAYENGVGTLDLSGGEFFTHPFAYQMLENCFTKKIKVNIATNAVSINLSFFQKYVSSDLLTMQISLDGLQQKHDARRGRGAYSKTIANVKALHALGIPLTVSMALDEDNYTDAVDVLQMPYFDYFILLPVAFAGAAKIYSKPNVSSEYEETITYLLQQTACSDESFDMQIFPRTMAIKYDGTVYPSPVASDYGLLCFGDLNQKSLRDIVKDYAKSDAYQNLSRVKNEQIVECNCCDMSHSCNRGCRIRALKFYGDILKPDPFYCKIYRGDFQDISIGKLFWGER